MRISTFTDYSLRVLIYLAVTDSPRVTRHEIASAYGISNNHLMKVINFLAHYGYVETVRGKGGGMCLARPPQKINIGQLIYDCEADIPLVECFLSTSKNKNKCALAKHCMLKHCLEDGLSAMYSKLKKYTLADAIIARSKIRRQLSMKPKAA